MARMTSLPDAVRRMTKPKVLKPKKWIAGAIKHPGALHESLGVPKGKTIPVAKIAKAAHSSNPVLAERARLAMTFRKMRAGRG